MAAQRVGLVSRMRVDTRIGFEYPTGGLRIFESGKKKLRIQKYSNTCGRGLRSIHSFGLSLICTPFPLASVAIDCFLFYNLCENSNIQEKIMLLKTRKKEFTEVQTLHRKELVTQCQINS